MVKLKIKDCSFRYGSRPVLEKVTLEIKEGDVVSIIGPNGTGKSTLLRCICRVLQPGGGVIYLNGKDAAHLSSRALARLLGYVPQSGAEVFPLTVYEAVLLGRKPYLNWGVGARDREIVTRILRFLRLEGFASKYLTELSGGEKQKVLIARALAREPEVLLLDEPTSNLDIKHQLEVLGFLQKLARQGKMTVVMVLHDLNLAARFSEQLILLQDGKVFAAGPPPAVLNPDNLSAVYGVEMSIAQNGPGIQVVRMASREDTPEKMKALRDEIMSRPGLRKVKAVKEGKVYVTSWDIATGCRSVIGTLYWAKWFHPQLFPGLDPEAVHREMLKKFFDQELTKTYVYP